MGVATDPDVFGIGVLAIFGYSVLLAFFVIFVVKENESGAKHLQFVSSVHATTFWLANFLFDYLIILAVIVPSIAAIVSFQNSAFSSGEPLAAIVLLLVSVLTTSLYFLTSVVCRIVFRGPADIHTCSFL